jgi:phosphoglycerate dehydrogenase-like enzyme
MERSATVERSPVLITFAPEDGSAQAINDALDGVATVAYLTDLSADERVSALASADAVLAWNLEAELRGEQEFEALASAGLVQLLSAGVDQIPLHRIPTSVTVASNAGAYADPMAEHVLAMALALAKRLPQNQALLAEGYFDVHTPTRAVRGAVAGVLGFGGIGQASARLFRALGARIHAINRSGQTDEPVEWIGTLGDLDALLAATDFLVISLPLTRTSRGLIGERELSVMKPDAILINVARGAVIDEDALYEHLRRNPSFSAGIDTWWEEPQGDDAFRTRRPFFELPNVLGSPHNSGGTEDSLGAAARDAAENILRYLRGEPPRHVVDRSEY